MRSKKSLRVWTHPGTGEDRIYINGTFRDSNKLFIADNGEDRIQSHSVNIDGKARGNSNVYKKREKDRDAIWEVLQDFGFNGKSKFSEVLTAVQEGL